MTDPYEIAITTYALTLCNSIEKEFAFNILYSTRLEVAGMIKYVITMLIGLFTHLARYYEGNSISKLQIQVATYVFELSAGNCHR